MEGESPVLEYKIFTCCCKTFFEISVFQKKYCYIAMLSNEVQICFFWMNPFFLSAKLESLVYCTCLKSKIYCSCSIFLHLFSLTFVNDAMMLYFQVFYKDHWQNLHFFNNLWKSFRTVFKLIFRILAFKAKRQIYEASVNLFKFEKDFLQTVEVNEVARKKENELQKNRWKQVIFLLYLFPCILIIYFYHLYIIWIRKIYEEQFITREESYFFFQFVHREKQRSKIFNDYLLMV